MNHRSAQRHMAGYLDESLASNRRRQMDEHIETCSDCSNEVRELRETVALLRGLPEPEALPNLAEAVLRRIAAGEAEPTWRSRANRWRADVSDALSSPRLALPVAAFVAVVALFGAGPDFQLFPSPLRSPGGGDTTSVKVAALAAPAFSPTRVVSEGLLRRVNGEMPEPMRFVAGPRGRLVRASAESQRLQSVPWASSRTPIRGDGALPSADKWIDVGIARPSNFATEHRRLSEIERELWVTYLARRAVETERFDPLVQALRHSPEPSVAALAEDFVLLGGPR